MGVNNDNGLPRYRQQHPAAGHAAIIVSSVLLLLLIAYEFNRIIRPNNQKTILCYATGRRRHRASGAGVF